MVEADSPYGDDYMCRVKLPNREISVVYNREILQKLNDMIPQSTAIAIQEALYESNAEALKEQLRKLLLQSASCHDTAGENFFHGLVLGLCAIMDNRYFVTSNRESGEGRYDIQLMPKDKKLPGILIELKAGKDCSEDELQALAKIALEQIADRKYETEMAMKEVEKIIRYGVAFSGKKVEVEINSL